jgi:hypothetical protein
LAFLFTKFRAFSAFRAAETRGSDLSNDNPGEVSKEFGNRLFVGEANADACRTS